MMRMDIERPPTYAHAWKRGASRFGMIKKPVPSRDQLFSRLAVKQQDARRGGVGADEFERGGDHEIAAFGDLF
ncbi:hypothetical protein LG52_666 [Geobacillus kaustophilus]|uniref:Uncharacterized protein n=1 Tax=Geobacillus kaustophilus TaxID=1462 RepID=A0A0D8BQ26_GEOKU|nr:hypothetical protein LG52_666 [Geobacillus kaustophilus]